MSIVALFAVTASAAFHPQDPRLEGLLDAGEDLFGPAIDAALDPEGGATLVFGGQELTVVSVADEPCHPGAGCLAGSRILALGTAGGTGVETLVSWSPGANPDVVGVVTITDGWLFVRMGGGCTAVPFHGTETEFHGTETELCPRATEADAQRGFVEAAIGSATEPRTQRALARLATWMWTVHFAP